MISYSCKFFSNKTLKFTKLMNFMQKLQYNAPNLMYIFQKNSSNDTRTPLMRGPRILNHLGPFSKFLTACLKIALK